MGRTSLQNPLDYRSPSRCVEGTRPHAATFKTCHPEREVEGPLRSKYCYVAAVSSHVKVGATRRTPRAGYLEQRLLLDGQQLNPTSRIAATQHASPHNFHRRYIRKSHGEVLFPKLLARRTQAFVTVHKLGPLRTRRAVEYEIEPRRSRLAGDRSELHGTRLHQLGRSLCNVFLGRRRISCQFGQPRSRIRHVASTRRHGQRIHITRLLRLPLLLEHLPQPVSNRA